jgi:hypothetical protein
MQVDDGRYTSSAGERKEKVEEFLATLKSLKSCISELREHFEELRQLELERQEHLMCSECGKLIEHGEEVTVKDSFGAVKGCYHKECFEELWRSQNWSFNYSSSGFLRMSGRGR